MAMKNKIISIKAIIDSPIERVWKNWTLPEDIVKWNYASDDWYSPHAENDLRVGGKFNYRMEARDGSFGFDFTGIYESITENEVIEYTIDDGRKVRIDFIPFENKTEIVETFEVENINSIELQRDGWQAILDNFKKHVEKSIKTKAL